VEDVVKVLKKAVKVAKVVKVLVKPPRVVIPM
jgi:hypothetical protein